MGRGARPPGDLDVGLGHAEVLGGVGIALTPAAPRRQGGRDILGPAGAVKGSSTDGAQGGVMRATALLVHLGLLTGLAAAALALS